MIPSFSKTSLSSSLLHKIDQSEKGIANGVCPLNASGLIDPMFIDPNALEFKGTWDALANNPNLVDGTGGIGNLYMVSIGGSQFTPTIDFSAGDYVVYDGSKWRKINGSAASAVTSLTSNNSYLCNIGGTSSDPVIQPKVGANAMFEYTFYNSAGAGDFVTDNNADLSLATTFYVGTAPRNRTDDQYVIHVLEMIGKHGIPFRMRIIDHTDKTKYAAFKITTLNGAAANYYQFSGTYDASNSTVTTFTNGTVIKLNFVEKQKTITAGTNISVNTTDIEAPVISTSATPSFTSVTVSSAPSASTDAVTKAYTDYNTTNNLNNCQFQTYSLSSQLNPSSLTYDANGSMLIEFPTANSWSAMKALHLHYNVKIKRHNSPQIPFWAIQMTGTDWNTTNDMSGIWMGFAPDAAFADLEVWGTSDMILGHDIPWDTTTTSPRRLMWGRFNLSGSHRIEYVINAVITPGTRTGNTSSSTFTVNDVLVCYLNSSYQLTLEWRDSTAGYAVKATGVLQTPDGPEMRANLHCNNIVPIFSVLKRGATRTVKVLSGRATTSMGITVTNGYNIFA